MTNDKHLMTKESVNVKRFKILGFIGFLWILSFGFCHSAHAVVDLAEIGVGARSLGLGRSYAAGLDDASSIFTNPAGLSDNPYLNMVSMNGNMLNDVNFLLVGITDRSPLGKFGIGYINASVGSIPLTTTVGSGSSLEVTQTGLTDFSSSVIYFTYGSKLSRFLKGNKGEAISFGGSLKIFNQGFSGGGSAMQNAVGAGLDADFGLIWRLKQWLTLGTTFNNMLPTSFGGKFTWQKNSVVEDIPMSIQTGARFKILGTDALFRNNQRKMNFLMDYETTRGGSRPSAWHLGLEFWPVDIVALRVGLNQKPKAAITGIGLDNNLTAGVGINFYGFTFDFAYHKFGELTENTTYFFSIGYRGIDQLKKQKQRRQGIKSSLPVPQVVPKPSLKSFTDIPEDFWARKPIEYLATLGIMGGYSDQTFRPNQPLSRAELAVLLVKAKDFKIKKPKSRSFKDVSPNVWIAPYIDLAVKHKYMSGYPNKTFLPNKGITRAEAAIIFAQYGGLEVKKAVTNKPFNDVSITHWAATSITAVKQAGYFEYLGQQFDPKKYITRAEIAEILSRTPTLKKKIIQLISPKKKS